MILRRLNTRASVMESAGVRRLSSGDRRLLADLVPHTRAHVLLLLGVHPGLALSSGRRSPARNRRVGGVPHSWHLVGRAVDLTGPLPLIQSAAEVAWRQRIGVNCTGPEEVLIEDGGQANQHLHVAW